MSVDLNSLILFNAVFPFVVDEVFLLTMLFQYQMKVTYFNLDLARFRISQLIAVLKKNFIYKEIFISKKNEFGVQTCYLIIFIHIDIN